MNTLILKLLAPITSHRLFMPIAVPVCAVAWGVSQTVNGPAGSWQHTANTISSGVVGLCALLGITSKGIEKDGTPTSSTVIVDPETGIVQPRVAVSKLPADAPVRFDR